MIFTDYYKGFKDPNTKTRYDVVSSSRSYDFFEQILINKKDPNTNGLSFYVVDRPNRWGNRSERKSDKAITKKEFNISSLMIPDPQVNIAYGDVRKTEDALIVTISPDWKELEIFISRGQKNNQINIYQLVLDGEYNDDMEFLRKNSQRCTSNLFCDSLKQ